MTTNIVRFAHVRQPRLSYTVAYTFDKNPDGSVTAKYGIAQCSNRDTFTRKAGRLIAKGRLDKTLDGKYQDIRSGTITIKDAEGVSVGREITKHFESERYNAMNHPQA